MSQKMDSSKNNNRISAKFMSFNIVIQYISFLRFLKIPLGGTREAENIH